MRQGILRGRTREGLCQQFVGTAVDSLDQDLGKAARLHLAEAAAQVFDRYPEAPVRADTALAEKFLREAAQALNLEGFAGVHFDKEIAAAISSSPELKSWLSEVGRDLIAGDRFRPDLRARHAGARAAAVKDGPSSATAPAARSVLDGREHDGRLDRVGAGSGRMPRSTPSWLRSKNIPGAFAGAIPAKVSLRGRLIAFQWRCGGVGGARRDRHAERRPLCCTQRS